MHPSVIKVLKSVQKFSSDNSPTILTAIAVAGTLSTTVLTARASFKAAEAIREEERLLTLIDTAREPVELDGREKVKLVWKLYIPAATSAGTTIACIVGANTISMRRGAALATAFSLSESAFQEYKSKVIEQIGANKEQKVRDDIARDRMVNDPVSSKQVIIAAGGDVLCYETMTGRYFKSDMETLRQAQNMLNARIISESYVSLNEFFDAIGLQKTGYGEEVGWTVDKLLELQFSTVLSEDGRPCLAVGYNYTPIREYYRFR